jgi:hypothetical protein
MTKIKPCNKCGTPIGWWQTKAEKWVPSEISHDTRVVNGRASLRRYVRHDCTYRLMQKTGRETQRIEEEEARAYWAAFDAIEVAEGRSAAVAWSRAQREKNP